MRKPIKIALAVCVMLFSLVSIYAAENAEFWNLGFSSDSRYFSFAQFWVANYSATANAELYFVDTARNQFVEGSGEQVSGSQQVAVGNNGRNAVLELVRSGTRYFDQYRINHLRQGRIIYINLQNEKSTSAVTFKDHLTNTAYTVNINQNNAIDGAAFTINGTVTKSSGKAQQLSVGLPNFFRPNVLSYSISQIILAPDESALVFVVEQVISDSSVRKTRFMIETVTLDQ